MNTQRNQGLFRPAIKFLCLSGLGLCVGSTALGAASTLQFAGGRISASEGFPDVVVEVLRSGDLDTVVGVDVQTTDQTAIAGLDYTAITRQLVFQAGETNQTVSIPLLNDGLVEPAETFQVVLSNPTDGAELGPRKVATVSITDNDQGLQLELSGYAANEDTGEVVVRVLRRDDGDVTVTVDYATAAVSAVPGVDYLETQGTLEFAPGTVYLPLVVPLLNDTVPESPKSFRIELSNPTDGASLGSISAATVTISDTDELVLWGSGNVDVSEAAQAVPLVVLRGENESVATIEVSTTDGSAMAGEDYVEVTRTLTFAAGERRQAIEIPLLKDGLKELIETFQVTLGNPTGGARLLVNPALAVRIIDDDPGFGFEANATSVWADQSAVTLKVFRGNDGWLEPFTVDYATADDTAVEGKDYLPISGTLPFAANQMVQTITVPLIPRPAGEKPRTSFRVNLANLPTEIPMRHVTCRVNIDDGSQGKPEWLQTVISASVGRSGDRVDVAWSGPAVATRAQSAVGPWEPLGTIHSPFVSAADRPGAFYRLQGTRPARLYVPSGYDGQTPMPLVLVLHGYSIDSTFMRDYFLMEPLAETRGFLVCHPDGTVDSTGRPFWNATEACCDFYGAGPDDSGYLRGLIEEVTRRYAVDLKRIYATGFSNGGYMSYRLAFDHADLIAGIASLAGMTYLDPEHPRPSEPVHILHIHGTADTMVLFGGGATFNMYEFYPGALATVQSWAAFNGCAGPLWDDRPTLDLDLSLSGLDTTVMRYTDYPPGGAVELWTIVGGGHVPAFSTGTSQSGFAARVIDWLLAHPKP